MRKNVWILNHYATNMYFDKAGRHHYFAKNMLEKGYKPTIFCATTNHFSSDEIDTNGKKFKVDQMDNIPYVFVSAIKYKGNKLRRVFNMLSFYFNLFFVTKDYVIANGKPDIILASSVHPLTLVAGIQIAKKLKVPCVCEIRDLWPESIFSFSTMSNRSIIANILYSIEKWSYKNADKLIFTMEGGKDYIVDKKWNFQNGGPVDLEKVYSINNGVDLKSYKANINNFQIDDEDLKNDDIFKVVYAGSIRTANKIEVLAEVANQLKDTNIKFLIWGSGDKVKDIEDKIKEYKLSNIILKGRVDKKCIPFILSKADLNISIYQNADVFKYGVSQNKLFEYFSSGKPVIQSFKPNFSLIEKYNTGIEIENTNVEELTEAIMKIYKLEKIDYNKICDNALLVAEEYDFKKLTNKLIDVIENA